MKPIGGYFELELPQGSSTYHTAAHNFKSGRSSLNAIIKSTQPTLIYVPFYTCNALLTPLQDAGIKYAFYKINNQLNPEQLPELKENEYFLYINYFDLKRKQVYELSQKYAGQLIVDNTQAFFMKGNGNSWFFNSCRKFFGVPDGSYLYNPLAMQVSVAQEKNEAYIFDHLLKRFNGRVQEGYPYFLKNEIACSSELKGMSKISKVLLSNINYGQVAEKRRNNFLQLHEALKKYNNLELALNGDSIPMFYPLWFNKVLDKTPLFASNLFIPTFWKDVLERSQPGFELEVSLVNQLLPLPVDHRYDADDMDFLIKNVISLL